MFLSRPNNPVRNDYAGPALVIKDLEVYCSTMNGNLTSIETECANLRQLLNQERQFAKQAVDFATWVMAQEPKLLHDYKSVANALTVIEGRENDYETASVQAGP